MMARVLLLSLAVVLTGEAAAQPYPSKPVRVVIPASPGGASDLVGRLVATQLSEMLGHPFVVENRVTSGGIVGTQQVAESPPDGYTLLVTFDTFASNALLFKNLKWDPVRDFAPVIQLCRYPQVLLVHPSLGVRTVKEFVALAKERGPQLNYASAGPASSSRLLAWFSQWRCTGADGRRKPGKRSRRPSCLTTGVRVKCATRAPGPTTFCAARPRG